MFQNVIAGNQHAPLPVVQADVARRVARRPDHFQRAVRGGDGFAAGEQAVRREPLEALLDIEHGRVHQRAHFGRDAGRGQDFLLPVAMQIGVSDLLYQQFVVGAVQVERRAGQGRRAW